MNNMNPGIALEILIIKKKPNTEQSSAIYRFCQNWKIVNCSPNSKSGKTKIQYNFTDIDLSFYSIFHFNYTSFCRIKLENLLYFLFQEFCFSWL